MYHQYWKQQPEYFKVQPQNYRVLWAVREVKNHLNHSKSPGPASISPVCSKPFLTWPWTPPGREGSIYIFWGSCSQFLTIFRMKDFPLKSLWQCETFPCVLVPSPLQLHWSPFGLWDGLWALPRTFSLKVLPFHKGMQLKMCLACSHTALLGFWKHLPRNKTEVHWKFGAVSLKTYGEYGLVLFIFYLGLCFVLWLHSLSWEKELCVSFT